MTKKEINLRNDLRTLTNVHVRNMYWLLFSPSPLAQPYFDDLPLFPCDWITVLNKESFDFFVSLDKSPQDLVFFLEDSNTFRMGVYAEKLMHYFLHHYTETTLLLSNYQVIDNKKTIGEIDFIFQWKKRVIHIELAVKFYLDLKGKNELKGWVGPSGNDHLLKKVDKVKTHQLQLPSNELFKKQTEINCKSYLFLKGMFFSSNDFSPAWKNTQITYRNYLRLSDFMSNESYCDYKLLKRPNWMSALYMENEDLATSIEGEDLVALIEKFNSLHLWHINKQTSIFVVKNEWPFNQQ